jgi:hypothetical protein
MGREKENYIEQLLKERDLERQVMIGNWAKFVVAHCNGCQFRNLFLVISFLNHAMTTFVLVFQDISGYFSK